MCGCNRERVREENIVTISFMVCTVLRKAGLDWRCM